MKWRLTMLAPGLIVLATVAAYYNSFAGVFVYDDITSIVENQTIRRLWPIGQVLSPPPSGVTVTGRPLLNLSLAINYALGGLNVWGYHAANLAIHIAAGLLLFGILRRTFLTPNLRERFGGAATPLALATALIWTVHPLQTESVTYIVQRAESLAGFFYLLTLYCAIRGAGERSAGLRPARADAGETPALHGKGEKGNGPASCCWRFWHATAVLACLLGMATKEVMVTAPLMVLLYDRTFLAGSLREAWRRRWGLYVGLAATWGLLGYLVLSSGLIGRQSELGAPDFLSYARTQPGVILHYLWLSIWPSSLCFDYAWPVASSLEELLPGAIAVALLLAATVWGLTRGKAWGFLGAWMFLILAPTSSVLPLAELAFEHRTYLPLVTVAVLAVVGGYALCGKLLPRPAELGRRDVLLRSAVPVVAWTAVLLVLGHATVVRNQDYRSSLTFWKDIVDKRPCNPVTHNGVGIALAAAGKTDEAIQHFNEALRLKPDYPHAHNNLGNVVAQMGRPDEAIEHYRRALRLKPDYVDAHNGLGLALAAVGRSTEAVKHFQEGLRLKPDHAAAHYNLANALAAMGKAGEAIEHYCQALRLEPDYADAHSNLAIVLVGLDRTAEAVEHFDEALRLKPDCAAAHYNLGIVLADLGRTSEAIEHYYQAVGLEPGFPAVRHNLARLLASVGRTHESVPQYNQLLQLVEDSTEPLNELAWLLAVNESSQGGDPARAVDLARRARELSGQENAECLDTLAAAYAAASRFEDAILTAQRALQLAESAGQTTLAQRIQSRLELYRAGRPYREASSPSGQSRP